MLPEDLNESGLIRWMRFLNGKNRKEFEEMAEKDEYIGEAYELLKNLSADEKKRIEYEYREKALKDYNSQMISSERRDLEKGEKIARLNLLAKFLKNGGSIEDAKKLLEATDEELDLIIEKKNRSVKGRIKIRPFCLRVSKLRLDFICKIFL